jgi:hypothetical protein
MQSRRFPFVSSHVLGVREGLHLAREGFDHRRIRATEPLWQSSSKLHACVVSTVASLPILVAVVSNYDFGDVATISISTVIQRHIHALLRPARSGSKVEPLRMPIPLCFAAAACSLLWGLCHRLCLIFAI